MKKILLLMGLTVFAMAGIAQNADLNAPIPVDENVKIGKLENGLTYYIRKNAKPENKVDLRLVVNAGSVLETDEQRGLAHFMEHMNFNGTKRFQHNDLVDYLQSIGVKFGRHLNAYTSFDETVYILPIPSDDAEKLEKGFQILEDWAFNALLTPEEIEKERGVVLEELRLGLGADKRMMQDWLPKMMYGSRYAERLPIGVKEVLENFDHKELQDFYNSWYRADLMAVVVVGDINVAEMEQKIKDHFGGYQNPENEKVRQEYYVPDHNETFVSIQQDAEASFCNVRLMYKTKGNAKPDKTVADYRQSVLVGLFNTMINNRLDEIANNPNPPFTYGYSYYGSGWSRNKKAYSSFAMSSTAEQMRALKTLLEENERVARFGFLESELDRAKKDRLSRFEASLENLNTTESGRFTREYVYNFLEGEVIPGIKWEYEASKAMMQNISLQEVNALIKSFIHDDNRVIVLTGPIDEANMATEQQVLDLLAAVKKMELKPYEEAELAESMITTMPKRGSIAKKTNMDNIDVTRLTLSNGATVYYKQTDFSDNEVLMRAYSPGGASLIMDDDDYKKTTHALDGLAEAGLNGFSQNDMNKMLSGKEVSVDYFIYDNYEGLRGESVKKDVETMFQLIHLHFTAMNKNEEAYNSYATKQKAFLGNIGNTPEYWYLNQRIGVLNKNNPRFTSAIPTPAEYDMQDYDLAYDIYNQRFANAADFTFFFVGAISAEEIEQLCELYIASLPATKQTEKWQNHPYEHLTGQQEFVFKKGTEPKSKVDIMFRFEAPYNKKDAYLLKSAAEILTIKLIENLREDESGVYGVGANSYSTKWPIGVYNFNISFPCGPENVEKLKNAALAELEKLIQEGPTEKDLNKVKETQKLELKENLKENEAWMKWLFDAVYYDEEMKNMAEAEAKIDALTAADIQMALQKYVGKNRVITILLPEE